MGIFAWVARSGQLVSTSSSVMIYATNHGDRRLAPSNDNFRVYSGPRRLRAESIESKNDRAIDREAGASERAPVRTGNQAILNECQDLKFLPHLAPIAFVDCVLGPLEQLRIPSRAVVQSNCRYSADYVVGPEAVGQVRRQTLPLRVCAVVCAIGGNEDALNRAGEGVVAAQVKLCHQRSERVVLDRRAQ